MAHEPKAGHGHHHHLKMAHHHLGMAMKAHRGAAKKNAPAHKKAEHHGRHHAAKKK